MILTGYLVASLIDFAFSLVYTAPEMTPAITNGSTGSVAQKTVDEDAFPVPALVSDQMSSGRVCCGDVASEMTSASGSGKGTGSGAGSGGNLQWRDENGSLFGKLINNENSVRILSSVLVGDFIHNYVDGIIIGAAFYNCSSSMAWGITGSTVAHELAQEIADFIVLTNPKHGGLTPLTALILNFVSGLSVVLGAVTILAQDNFSNFDQGCLLAFGGGVYLQIGATECMARVHNYAKTIGLRFLALTFFCIGAAAIGLVLLKHEHCVPDSAAGGGGGGHAH